MEIENSENDKKKHSCQENMSLPSLALLASDTMTPLQVRFPFSSLHNRAEGRPTASWVLALSTEL